MTTLHILHVEDSPTDAKLIARALREAGHVLEISRVDEEAAMREALAARPWDAILCDWSMPRFSALAALVAIVRELKLDVPFIIISGTIGEEVAVEAMRHGAHDYILKDRLARLAPAVERELREHAVREAARRSAEGQQRAEAALTRSEEQLRQAQKMEAVGRLAGGVAHDFNNILSVILSYGEIIFEGMAEGDRARDDLEQIIKAGRRAADLTRQLLMFSRQEVAEPRVFDLDELLGGMDRMLVRILGEDVELVSRRAAKRGRICADPGHLEQVVMNLVVNARDAMPTGGTLAIETRDVELDETHARELALAPGPYVVLAVSDTGIGMDRATQARIFEPFFTTKDRSRGTGLGLSTVFGIIQQCHGSIAVTSEPGAGATFEVYLPRAEAVPDAKISGELPVVRHGTETILLAEDDTQIRAVACVILRELGYTVIDAADASEALRRAAEHPGKIDLLLTDVVMPQLSGPELAKRLQHDHPAMKVLFMSGYTDDTLVRHAAATTGLTYLQKPLTPGRLARKVRAILDS